MARKRTKLHLHATETDAVSLLAARASVGQLREASPCCLSQDGGAFSAANVCAPANHGPAAVCQHRDAAATFLAWV